MPNLYWVINNLLKMMLRFPNQSLEISIWDLSEWADVVVKMTRPRVKITVLKRIDPSVIFNGDVPNRPGTDEKYTICTARASALLLFAVKSA